METEGRMKVSCEDIRYLITHFFYYVPIHGHYKVRASKDKSS